MKNTNFRGNNNSNTFTIFELGYLELNYKKIEPVIRLCGKRVNQLNTLILFAFMSITAIVAIGSTSLPNFVQSF